MPTSRRLAYLAILGNVFLWGAALPIVKPALTYLSPYHFLLLRYLVASFLMAPFVFIFWPKKMTLKTLGVVILGEFIQICLSLSLLYQGLALTSALSASLIGSSAPIFITLGGIIFLKEKEEGHEWLGLMLSVAGTLIITLSPLINSTQSQSSTPLGLIFLLGYQLTNALYLLYAKKHYHHLSKPFIASISCLTGLFGYTLIAPLFGPMTPLSILVTRPEIITAVLYMGVFGSALAVGLYLYGQAKIEASEASLFTYLQPLVYLPLSYLLFRELPTVAQLVGLALTTFGVFLASSRSLPQRRQPRT